MSPSRITLYCSFLAIWFTYAQAHPPELVLAGGSLNLCSSLSTRHCADKSTPAGRVASLYSLSRTQRKSSLSALKSILNETQYRALESELSRVRQSIGVGPHDATALDEALWQACREPRCAWRRMNDDQRAAVLASLELGQFDAAGKRIPERVSLAASRDPSGAAILRDFVARAGQRSGEQAPRVAVVTASGFDPFDAVDYYLGALAQAGAEPMWWPIDAALAERVFGDRDCDQLGLRHAALLGLPDRSAVFPDRVAEQHAWCRSEQAASVPANIHGVFFAGGDQWKLRSAFFGPGDQPNAWLRELRRRHASGELVIAGTSAGTAVQAGPGMLSNGSPQQALIRGPQQARPPKPGCSRSKACGDLHEDSFTVWPAGGLGLAAPFLMDTHFSERAREWRLMRALADGPARAAIGVDETSAVAMTQHADQSWTLNALGRSGAWLFETEATSCGRWQGRAHYLSAGTRLRWTADSVSLQPTDITQPLPPSSAAPLPANDHPSFGEGAIRLALQPLASGARAWSWRAEGALLSFSQRADTQHRDSPGRPPTLLRLGAELSFAAMCDEEQVQVGQ
ncbi:cyanophycinase [Pseudomarimonas arenosa]|uniref:Cyanophycinase n=1 Tax=Pseudomarimonas arenosa TaxID=2774145 RepID=A0AAW3ZI85_9GAMM|nr:cyanophycinase [Pseudomarimonas arenosa]MBD8525795.1 cyanophycinase [Pseudomarimonas arenosa]